MEKILIGIFVAVFLVAGSSDQAWAFAKRSSSKHGSLNSEGWYSGHHSENDNSGNSGYHYGGDNDEHSGGYNNGNSGSGGTEGGNTGDNGSNGGNNGGNNDIVHHSDDDNVDQTTATTAVPEPATLALMGMGLGGVFLRRRRASKS